MIQSIETYFFRCYHFLPIADRNWKSRVSDHLPHSDDQFMGDPVFGIERLDQLLKIEQTLLNTLDRANGIGLLFNIKVLQPG